jgi:hypothetical protein
MPDRLHYHQLVMRALEITLIGRDRRTIANPLATLVILPLASAPVLAGVLLWNKPLEAFLALGGFAVLFVLSYIVGIKSLQSGRLPFGRRSPAVGLQAAKVLVPSAARKRVG